MKNIYFFCNVFCIENVYKYVNDKPTQFSRNHYTYELRTTAVEAVKNGSTVAEVVSVMGMSARTVFHWLVWFSTGSYEGLKDNPKSGRPRKITEEMAQWLYNAVTMGNPKQFQFDFCLWSLKTMQVLLKQQFGVSVHVSTISRLLHSMGLTPQRPIHKSYKQNQKKIKRYLEMFPGLKQRAEQENALILFLDEAPVRADYHRGTTWSRIGVTPVVRDAGDRYSIKLVSAISADGRMIFNIFKGKMNAQRFCEFLSKLSKDVGRKIIVVCDNASYHTADYTQEFVAENDNIEMKYLPPYSPELNPDEQVWNHLKQRLAKIMIPNKKTMQQKIQNIMQSIQKKMGMFQSYFKLDDTRYIIT